MPGYYGDTVTTSYTLSVFLDWFTLITKSDRCKARVFNCTEGGAYIDGMLHVPFERMLARLPQDELSPAAERIGACVEAWDAVGASATMQTYMDRMHEGIERCLWLIHECKRAARRARQKRSYLDELRGFEEELQSELGKIPFASMAATEEIRKATAEGTQAGSVDDSLAAAEHLYDVILHAVTTMRAPLAEARGTMRED